MKVRKGITCEAFQAYRKVLGADRVQELHADRDTHIGKIAQKLTGDAKAFVDVERAVDIRIVYKSLPADSGPGFFTAEGKNT